jgi:hypothetical protein
VSHTTRAFVNPLSDAGVTFEGFQTIKIPSREAVREKLQDFLIYCSTAKKPAIRVILGEWGEGKTDTYVRYLSPQCEKQGNSAYFASASTLANSYRDPDVQALFATTNLEAVRFLVALFNAVREEEKKSDIPQPKKHKSAEDYVNETLSALSKKRRKVIFFIDEFEELLLHPDILGHILSGIKETVNGHPRTIDESGRFAGCLHLVVAATPDAFYRLAVNEDTSLIFGGLGRRAGIIDLPQIRKSEALKFLFALLLHAYDGKLPVPAPVDDIGILETFVRISQGNPGNMVSLFTRMLNSARERNKPSIMSIINYDNLLHFLENEHIFVYGGETPCIEKETYSRILKILGEEGHIEAPQLRELFRVLIADLRPFSARELSRILGITETQAKNMVNIINNELRSRERIEKAILKVSRLKKEKSITDVSNAFKEYIESERDRKLIKIDNYSESVDEFDDRLTFFELDDNGISSTMFLPPDPTSVAFFFDGISRDKSIEIGNMIDRHLADDEDYYLASEELLSQIYPTPVPRELEFVRDRDVRLKLWREVTKNLIEQYDQYMPSALIDLVQRSRSADFTQIKSIGPRREYYTMKIEGIMITTLMIAVNGDVKSADIEDVSRWIKSNTPPVLCCVIAYTGEMTADAEDKIENKELGKNGDNLIVGIRLHPTLAKRIIAVHRAVTDLSPKEMDETVLTNVLGRIVSQDIDFANTFQVWLKEQETRGVAIGSLKIESTSNLREFADSLKFFINFLERQATPKEIYQKNQEELLGFVRYNSRLGLIPDIELPKFERLIVDLLENGFLKKVERNKYSIRDHPVEARLLKVLGRFQKLVDAELEQHFINEAGPKLLRDVYLPILEYKGRIIRSGHIIELADSEGLRLEVESDIESFQRMSTKSDVKSFGFAYQWKKKGDHKFISLKLFQAYIESLHRRVRGQLRGRNDRALQQLSLLKRLVKYFQTEFVPLFEKAAQQSNSLKNDCQTKFQEFEGSVDNVREKSAEWLKLDFTLDDIQEYAQASQTCSATVKYSEADENAIQDLVGKFTEDVAKLFYFDKDEGDAWYFNPKLYQISKASDTLNALLSRCSPTVASLNSKFAQLDSKRKSITETMSGVHYDPSYRISSAAANEIRSFSKDIVRSIEPEKLQSTSLDDIGSHFDRNHAIILNSLDQLEKAVAALVKLSETEKDALRSLGQADALQAHCLPHFDAKELKNLLTELSSEITASKREYQGLSKLQRLETPNELVDTISCLREQITGINERVKAKTQAVEQGWMSFCFGIDKSMDTVESALKILSKRGKLEVGSLRTQIASLKSKIDVESLMALSQKISELEELKTSVLEEFYDAVKTLLDRKEAQVFNALIEHSRQGRKSWLLEDEIYDIGRLMSISNDEINRVLRKLAKLQLIAIGVSVPI